MDGNVIICIDNLQLVLFFILQGNLTELKSFGAPPPAVVNVCAAVICLMSPGGKVPKDKSWKAAKAGIMGKVDAFLDNLINYDKDNIHENCLKAVAPYLADPEMNYENIKGKSMAAAGLLPSLVSDLQCA